MLCSTIQDMVCMWQHLIENANSQAPILTFGGEAQESAFYHSLWTIPMCATVRSVHLELPYPVWQSVAICSS